MKKLLILLLVFVVAGGVFAQELKWSSGVLFGLGIKSDESAPPIQDNEWWESGDDSKAAGFVQTEYAQDNYGFLFKVRGRFSRADDYDLTIPKAKVWFDLLDDKIGIRAGRLDESLWNTQADWLWQVTKGVGALVEIKPIEGLSFGAIFKTNVGATSYDDDNDPDTDKVSIGDKFVSSPEELLKRAAFGVSYTMTDTFYASASLQLAAGDRVYKLNGTKHTAVLNDAAEATYGLNILAVPNLILNTEGLFGNIGGDEDISFNLRQDIGYKIIPGTFKAGVKLAEESPTSALKLTIKPYGEYVINSLFTTNLEVQVSTALADNATTGLYIQPKLQYTIGGGAKIHVYYKLDFKDLELDPVHTVYLTFMSTF
jgi:hypothetical protein